MSIGKKQDNMLKKLHYFKIQAQIKKTQIFLISFYTLQDKKKVVEIKKCIKMDQENASITIRYHFNICINLKERL